MIRRGAQGGVTLAELVIGLAVAGLLAAGAAKAMSNFGSRGNVKREAARLVDALWELRSMSTMGKRNPCVDFPDASTVRLFSDSSEAADGFGRGDQLIRSYSYSGGVKALAVSGGSPPGNFVCFEGRGVMGSAGAPLLVTLGRDAAGSVNVRLLPSTGLAKIR